MKNSYLPPYRRGNGRSAHHHTFDSVETAGDALMAGLNLSNFRMPPHRPHGRRENEITGRREVPSQQGFRVHDNDREEHSESNDKVIRSWPLPQSDLPMAIESLRQTATGSRRAIDIFLPQFNTDNADDKNGIAAALDNVAQLAPRRRPKIRQPKEMGSAPAKTLRRLVLGNGQVEVEERLRRINTNFNRVTLQGRSLENPYEHTRLDWP